VSGTQHPASPLHPEEVTTLIAHASVAGLASTVGHGSSPGLARGLFLTSWRRVAADYQGQRRADDGTSQTGDALECPRLGRALAKEPGERVPEPVVGHEPVGGVL